MNSERGVHVYQMSNGYWRAWDQDRHVHHAYGEGSCAIDSTSRETAIEKLGELMWKSSPGLSCTEGICPKWKYDFY